MLSSMVLAQNAPTRLSLPYGIQTVTVGNTVLSDIEAVAQRRDKAAFGRLFEYFAPRVKAYLRRLGAGDDVADDLAQEVMVSIWRRAHQFDPGRAALSTWIFTIARNKRIDAIRRERRPEFDPEDPSLQPTPSPRGDSHVETQLIAEAIREAINKLPAEQAELLRIFYFEDRTQSTIAEDLGIPLGTVKSRLRLAIGKLRMLLEDLCE